jgi:PTS system mannitol-specific IIC component
MLKRKPILAKKNIILGLKPVKKEEAIRHAAELLIKDGYTKESYLDEMFERETVISTYIGKGVAIPHGISENKKVVKHSGIVILQYPKGIEYNGHTCYLVIGVAGKYQDHLRMLAKIAQAISKDEVALKLRETKDLDFVYKTFTKRGNNA